MVSVCETPKLKVNCKCQQTCDTYASDIFECPSGDECKEGCQCPFNMLEDADGNCIAKEDCPCYDSCTHHVYQVIKSEC